MHWRASPASTPSWHLHPIQVTPCQPHCTSTHMPCSQMHPSLFPSCAIAICNKDVSACCNLIVIWLQVTGPIYKLVATNLGGEKRFAAAVARRLQSLGALTRGDRRAASGIDLSESNFDSPLGRKSLRWAVKCIQQARQLAVHTAFGTMLL